MRYRPHSYQEYVTEFIGRNPVSAIFLACGLGKSVIALTALANLLFDSFEIRRVIVIAPLRVASQTWPEELAKWDHLSHLTYSVAIGTADERKAALRQKADLYIINRENTEWAVDFMPDLFSGAMLIIDESSSFKNHQAKRFKAIMKVRPKVKRVVLLSATPAANNLMDLWAQFRLLDMGQRLGRFIGQYRREFFEPDKRRGEVVFSYRPLPGAEEHIYERIADITISMKSADHLRMPDLISAEHTVHLDEKERARYDAMKRDLVLSLDGGEVTAANAAALSGKLLQMAGGAVYGDGSGEVHYIHDRKLDALEDLIEASCGKPVIVAYWYKHDLSRIEERLAKLKAPFSRLGTSESIAAWNRGGIPVALIHPASAGHGLNLQSGGSALIWFSLTWSLELYQQTNARLWRQGQKSDTVVIHHITCKGTIDERVMRALAAKDKTQSALIDAVRASL